MRLRNEVLPLFLMALGTGPLMGVGTTGTIVGMVTDPSGALVANAKVTVLNQGTGAVREAYSNVGGEYAVPLLPPAVYQVTVEAAGFRSFVDKSIQLNVDQTVRVNAKLELGAVSQAVVVNAAAPLIPTDTSTVGQVVNQQMVSQLPLNERNFLQFTLLVPGAQMPSDGSQNSTQGGAVSVDGAREQSNNFLLDGVDNNDLAINQYSVLPSMDAIEEFKVQSSNSSAEFGRSGGGQINVVLKSGTNQFHGTAFEFLRNRHLDAKNFFDRPDCAPSSAPGTCADIPRLDRSQFGGSLSGPIRRDKAFFFLDYEGLRLRQATTRQATVPSQDQLATALAAFPPSSPPNSAGLNVLNLYPAANVGSDLLNSNTFVGSPVIRNTVHQFTGKIDYQGWTTDTLSGHYALFDENRFNPYDPLAAFTNLPGYGSFTQNRGQNVGLDWTHIFSSRVVNEARMGFNRLRGGIFQEHFGTDESKMLGFPDVLSSPIDLGFPAVFIAGFDGIGEPVNAPQDRHDNTFHYSDNLAWSPAWNGGRHTLKFGVDVRRFQLNFFLDSLARGEWVFLGGPTGDPLQELLNGTPDLVVAVQGNTQIALRTTGFDYYAQDDIHVNSRLTLNLGLRYEFNSPAVDKYDRLTVPDLSSNSVTCSPQPDCQFIRGGTSGIPRATYRPTKNDYAPRAGFAWRPLASDRLVVRGAYGVFYDVAILNGNILPRFNPPFFVVNLLLNSGTNTIQDILSQPGLPSVVPNMIAPDYRDGYLQHWTLNVQEEVARDLVLDVGYVGSEGTHLVDTRDINQATSPGGPFPFPQFSDIEYLESGASSNYHSLQLRVEKRFSRGLTFLSAYTWSKSIDDASALFGTRAELGFPQNSYNLGAERGLSNFDTRHRFVASTIYELPFGSGKRWLSGPGTLHGVWGNWKLSGILAFQSGRPFTVYRAVSQSNTLQGGLGFFDRPDLIANPFKAGPVAGNSLCVAPSRVRDASSWFNPCAFASPSTPRFGTAGRNDITGPPLDNVDFSLLKEFPLRNEARRIQLRFEFFNFFNHPNFDLPNNNFDTATLAAIQSANAYGNKPPRQIQLGLKFVF